MGSFRNLAVRPALSWLTGSCKLSTTTNNFQKQRKGLITNAGSKVVETLEGRLFLAGHGLATPDSLHVSSPQHLFAGSMVPAMLQARASASVKPSLGIRPAITGSSNATNFLSVNPPGAALQNPVTFTSTVAAAATGGGVPTGTVSFFADGNLLATQTLSAGGVATLTLAAGSANLATGPHNITSTYNGDGTYATQNSAPVPLNIGPALGLPTTTTVSGDLYGVPLGAVATVSATVTPQTGLGVTPTGMVTFFQTVIAGTPAVATLVPIATVALNGMGVATFTTTSLVAGSHQISASYTGDIVYAPTPTPNPAAVPPVVFPSFNEVIGAALVAATTLATSAPVIALGGTVTITATETPLAPGAVPTGLVTFTVLDTTTNMTTVLGTFPLQANINSVSLTTSNLPAGVDNITAQYAGDLNYNMNNSGVLIESVGLPNGNNADTVTLATSAIRVAVNGVVTFSAAVTASTNGLPVPTGTVTFYDGATIIGQPTQLTLGRANLTTVATNANNLPAGLDTISAVYSGDPNFQGATSQSIVEVVGNIPTGATLTTLAASTMTPPVGGSVTLIATVSDAVSGTVPTGIVSFIEGPSTLGTATVQSDGTATFVFPSSVGQMLSAGTDAIIATYSGDLTHTASTSTPVTLTIGSPTPGTTSTALTSNVTTLSSGGAVTFTATVTPALSGNAAPTGTVSFVTGTTVLGSAPVQANGEAVFTTSALPTGIDNVSASYSGDTIYISSSSPAVSEYVGAVVPTYNTSITISSGVLTASQPVTITANVTPSGTGIATPTGIVNFFANGSSIGTGVVQNGVATLTTQSVPAGNEVISATFSGNTGISAASNPLTLMVSNQPTSVAVPTLVNPVIPSTSVAGTKFHARLPVAIKNSGSAALSGTYTINVYASDSVSFDGTEILVASQSRNLTLKPGASKTQFAKLVTLPASLPGGNYYLIAQIIDPTGASNSVTSTKTVMVSAPTVTLSATTTSVSPTSIALGKSGSISVTITNSGTIDALGQLVLSLGVSTDGSTQVAGAQNTLATFTQKTRIKAGKSHTFRVHFKPTTAITAGTYFPSLTIQLAGQTLTLVGTTTFTVG